MLMKDVTTAQKSLISKHTWNQTYPLCSICATVSPLLTNCRILMRFVSYPHIIHIEKWIAKLEPHSPWSASVSQTKGKCTEPTNATNTNKSSSSAAGKKRCLPPPCFSESLPREKAGLVVLLRRGGKTSPCLAGNQIMKRPKQEGWLSFVVDIFHIFRHVSIILFEICHIVSW